MVLPSKQHDFRPTVLEIYRIVEISWIDMDVHAAYFIAYAGFAVNSHNQAMAWYLKPAAVLVDFLGQVVKYKGLKHGSIALPGCLRSASTKQSGPSSNTNEIVQDPRFFDEHERNQYCFF